MVLMLHLLVVAFLLQSYEATDVVIIEDQVEPVESGAIECTIDDVKQKGFRPRLDGLESGSKIIKFDSIMFNEYSLSVRAGLGEEREDLGPNIEQISLGLSGLGPVNSILYLSEDVGFDAAHIPGQHFYSKVEIEENPAEEAKQRLSESSTETFDLNVLGADANVPKTTVTEAKYDIENVEIIIEIFMEAEREANSRLYLRVLGPTIKNSPYKQRGIILKFDTFWFEQGENKYRIHGDQLSEEVIGQLDLIHSLYHSE
ncbi:hypothetical protein Ciccas_005596 [Cichlidogyrus casuarinus]|uniref:Uncharacterized protein n=1 Tax=Cichlidogyrus casuarinus TaxID=1844966 RepID=A0ABD2Q871_9PLAT